MTATIKDVAKLAEVSISTVSRVINDSKPVSPEARRRVLKAIDELGYKPNEVARSLVTKRSSLIGVIVDDIGNYYVSQVVRGIEEIGRMYNYDIVLCSSYGGKEAELKFIQLLKQKQVEGIILVSEIQNEKAVEYIKKSKDPFVYLNRYYNVLESPTVTIDNEKASKQVMEHLIDLGHKNIIYITQAKDVDLTIESYKINGYKTMMESVGVEPIILKANGHKMEDGYKIGSEVKEMMDLKGTTAVFCCQDEVAIGLINYLSDHDIKVPDDISVVGYGDITLSSIYRPQLTTIREPHYDIGAVAIRRILKSLKGEKVEERTITLPTRLMIRQSSKKV